MLTANSESDLPSLVSESESSSADSLVSESESSSAEYGSDCDSKSSEITDVFALDAAADDDSGAGGSIGSSLRGSFGSLRKKL